MKADKKEITFNKLMKDYEIGTIFKFSKDAKSEDKGVREQKYMMISDITSEICFLDLKRNSVAFYREEIETTLDKNDKVIVIKKC